jgi:hypothetical protein
MKHFIATIRHHRFRLEQLPFEFRGRTRQKSPAAAIAVGAAEDLRLD